MKDNTCCEDQWDIENCNGQRVSVRHDDRRNKAPIVLPNTHHLYEEVESSKKPYDTRDRDEEYNSVTTDKLFLSQCEICEECMRMKRSPVYTDRLIYAKESLFAIEVVLCQRDDALCFKYLQDRSDDAFCSQYDRDRDYMLVYSYVKTNSASILYSRSWPQDVFDLKLLLKPSIHVISRTCRSNITANTQVYHRYANNYHVRISRAGCAPTVFCHHGHSTVVSCTKRISWYNDSQDSLSYQMQQLRDRPDEHRGHRSSLLLLEPLLLMPEMARSGRKKTIKNHALRSERAKLIKILIAYVISFFILASITVYIVYFT